MVALYALRASEKAVKWRKELLEVGIPAVLIGPEYGFASMAERVPFVWIDPDSAPFGNSFRKKIPIHKLISCAPDASAAAAVRTAYLRENGVSLDSLHAHSIRYVTDAVYFRGNMLFLTPDEKRILTLLLVCGGTYFTADEIAAACLNAGKSGAAAVHVCHMNAKAVRGCHVKMIECRRYAGYRIP